MFSEHDEKKMQLARKNQEISDLQKKLEQRVGSCIL
jgi:hypothetical protein